MGLHSALSGAELHFSRLRTGTGNPNTVVSATVIGEAYFDLTAKTLYVASATGLNNWEVQVPSPALHASTHFTGGSDPIAASDIDAIDISEKGAAGGVATLDGSGKVPVGQLPASAMEYKGVWNATTNTPTLADGAGDAGDVYRVSVAGTYDLGSGPVTYGVGDLLLYDGTIWQKSDSTDSVNSVNGFTGTIVLTTTDIAEGANLYFTTSRARTAAVADAIVDGVVDVAPSQNAVFDALALKQATGNYITQLSGDVVAMGPGAVTAAIQAGVITNAMISASAAIARAKIAAGTASYLVVNDGAGLLTEIATLNETRGGTNQTSFATGDTLYASASNTLAKRSIGSTGQVSKVVGGIPAWEDWIEASLETRLFEDWIGDGVGTLRWLDADTTTGDSKTTRTHLDANHPGVLELATGIGTTGAAIRYLGGVTSGTGTSGFMVGGGQLSAEWLVYIDTLSNATDEYNFSLNLTDTISAPTAIIGFIYQRTSNVNWLGQTRSASVTTSVDSGVAVVAGSWIKLKVVVNAAGTSVEFFINGVSVGTSTTNIPTGTVIAPRVATAKTAGTTSRSNYVDYFKLYQRLTSAR